MDNIIFIDADLQDPPELILEMYNYLKEGYDSVLAKRVKKEKISRNIISNVGYYVISKLT